MKKVPSEILHVCTEGTLLTQRMGQAAILKENAANMAGCLHVAKALKIFNQ